MKVVDRLVEYVMTPQGIQRLRLAMVAFFTVGALIGGLSGAFSGFALWTWGFTAGLNLGFYIFFRLDRSQEIVRLANQRAAAWEKAAEELQSACNSLFEQNGRLIRDCEGFRRGKQPPTLN